MKKSVLVLVALTISSVPAFADFAPIGPAEISNSWTQSFELTDLGWDWGQSGFDAVRIDMVVGELEIPGMTNATEFPTVASNGPSTVIAYGDFYGDDADFQTVDFTLNFEGSLGSPVVFNLLVADYRWGLGGYGYYASGEVVAAWNGSSWGILDISAELDPDGDPVADMGPAPAPVPGAVLLGVLGLSAAGMRLRKRA